MSFNVKHSCNIQHASSFFFVREHRLLQYQTSPPIFHSSAFAFSCFGTGRSRISSTSIAWLASSSRLAFQSVFVCCQSSTAAHCTALSTFYCSALPCTELHLYCASPPIFRHVLMCFYALAQWEEVLSQFRFVCLGYMFVAFGVSFRPTLCIFCCFRSSRCHGGLKPQIYRLHFTTKPLPPISHPVFPSIMCPPINKNPSQLPKQKQLLQRHFKNIFKADHNMTCL